MPRTYKSDEMPHILRHTLNYDLTSGILVKRLVKDSVPEMKSYPHRDDYYIIVLVTGGTVAVAVDFEDVTISAGEAIVVSPSQVHSPSSAAGGAEGWLLALASEYFTPREIDAAARYALHTAPIAFDEKTSDDIVRLFGILLRRIGDTSVAQPLASAIKSLVFSGMTEGNGRGNADRYMAIVTRLKKLIDANLKNEKRPSRYAEMLNISEVYLNEAVKKATGLSVSAFIRSQVVLAAKRHLVYTLLSASEIALELGYEDYAYFSKLFKKDTGVSPTQYRKNIK